MDTEVSVTTEGPIHYVDAARSAAELRTVCGTPTPVVQWTTVRGATTCADCARLAKAGDQGSAKGVGQA